MSIKYKGKLIAGLGIPPGGTTGQVPAKASDKDFDIQWVDVSSSGDSSSDSSSMDIYSEEEQVIGTWIDGKPIYRKVITGTIPERTSATTWDANLWMPSGGKYFDTCIKMDTMYDRPSGYIEIAGATSTVAPHCYVYNDVVLKIEANAATWLSYQNSKFFCIFEYTRSFD